MTMSDASEFSVFWHRDALAGARTILDRARTVGRVQDLAAILRSIEHRLLTNPLDQGEVYLSRGRVHQQTVGCGFVGLSFAVCTERKLVLVRECWLLPNRGL